MIAGSHRDAMMASFKMNIGLSECIVVAASVLSIGYVGFQFLGAFPAWY
jgi:hypothetical protein